MGWAILGLAAAVIAGAALIAVLAPRGHHYDEEDD